MKLIFKLNELKELSFWRAVFGELVVSALFIILVCGGTIELPGRPKVSDMHASIVVTFTVAVLASVFWEISGGHFNPAVSLAMCITGNISVIRFLLYVPAQCIGSIAGAGVLYAITPKVSRDTGLLGSLGVHPNVSVGSAFVLEAILTFVLVFTIFTCTDPANNMVGFQRPFVIGLSVGASLLMGIPFSGAALNPIRPLGPGVVMNKLDNNWIYWIGPFLGSLVATFTYKFIFILNSAKNEAEDKATKDKNYNEHELSSVKENPHAGDGEHKMNINGETTPVEA